MEQAQAVKESQADKQTTNAADRVMITYYTDPLCCWSWALDKHWKKLLEQYAGSVRYRYVMGGLIPDWERYNDPLNAVTRPFQLGPVWMHASHVTNTPMKFNIWHEHPPTSSYPACIAVKCAEKQSARAGALYLDKLRETLMLEGRDISDTTVLLDVAKTLAAADDAFDDQLFVQHWNNGDGRAAFRQDLQEVAFQKIGRFPTLTFTNNAGKGVIITGYRPYEVLVQALEQNFKGIVTPKSESEITSPEL